MEQNRPPSSPLPAGTVRGLRRSRSADELPGSRLRHGDATGLHELVHSVQTALGETASYELVVTPGVGVLVASSRRRSRSLAIGFPLIVQAERTELLALVAGAILEDRAARRRLMRLAFDWLADPGTQSVLGPEAAASAMLREDLVKHLLADEFWVSVWSEAATSPEPPSDVFERMAEFLSELPEARPETGAHGSLLPAGALARVAAELSRDWQNSARDTWRTAHAQLSLRAVHAA